MHEHLATIEARALEDLSVHVPRTGELDIGNGLALAFSVPNNGRQVSVKIVRNLNIPSLMKRSLDSRSGDGNEIGEHLKAQQEAREAMALKTRKLQEEARINGLSAKAASRLSASVDESSLPNPSAALNLAYQELNEIRNPSKDTNPSIRRDTIVRRSILGGKLPTSALPALSPITMSPQQQNARRSMRRMSTTTTDGSFNPTPVTPPPAIVPKVQTNSLNTDAADDDNSTESSTAAARSPTKRDAMKQKLRHAVRHLF